MLNVKSFLAVDFGAGSLKLAEFEVNEAGGLVLKQYAIKSLGLEGSQEAKREAFILKVLQEVIAERGIKAKEINVCAPGFHVFAKFVKLPPVDPNKVTQIIQYEAQQNVPFPLAEVVWDYQILGTAAGGELEVLLVAIKSDIVEGLFRVTESAGLRLQICDVSPAALCNAFRYNYSELEDCTMLLDIGAKTSNLLFFEKGKVFSRSISLGANSITQDFASESKLKFDPAEKIKIEEGFVSLGGAYEEPENPNQAAISKIARQFMTRLHIQVNQTLQFYRGQQGGSAPARLYLAGGASLMPYTAQFFAEKLNVPVEYLNPFRAIQIDPAVNLEELAKVAHSLGEVVGLGLRNLATCPVELNLMPESTLRWQSFNQKKPYFIATVFSLVAMAFAVGFLFNKLADVKRDQVGKLEPQIAPLQAKEQQFKRAHGDLKKSQKELEQLTTWMEDRYGWVDLLKEIRTVLIRVEELHRRKFGHDTGLWIENLKSFDPLATGVSTSDPNAAVAPAASMPSGESEAQRRAFMERYGIPMEGRRMEAAPPMAGDPNAPPATNDPNAILVTIRGVSLDHLPGFPNANKDMAFAVQGELKNSPLLDPVRTELYSEVRPDETNFTFTFSMSLLRKSKEPAPGAADPATPVDPNAPPPADPNAPPP